MQLKLEKKIWPLNQSFNISRGSKNEAVTIELLLTHDGYVGRGECVPYSRYNETPDTVIKEFDKIKFQLESNEIDNNSLQKLMEPGSARNALDCALYDLNLKTNKISSWDFFKVKKPSEVETCYTIVLDDVKKMTQDAKDHANYPILKIKVDEKNLREALEEIRSVAPNPKIILDANEGLSVQSLDKLINFLDQMDIALMEQPVDSSKDSDLEFLSSPVPLCADESFHNYNDIQTIFKKYDYINIKLDKTGGLTEAFKIAKKTRELNKGIMIGCMVGSSLSMMPALLLHEYADYIDLDGPCFLKQDQVDGLSYSEGLINLTSNMCWG